MMFVPSFATTAWFSAVLCDHTFSFHSSIHTIDVRDLLLHAVRPVNLDLMIDAQCRIEDNPFSQERALRESLRS